ncbi:MAG: metallopeptidase TldD-related protein [Bacillota bacterium]
MSAGIAQTLIHETLGHALEIDQWPTSMYANRGRLRVGEKVAAPGLTITDGWWPNQYGWQPFSASGDPRRPIKLVDRGTLRGGLTDPYYGPEAGVDSNGSDRVASYRSLPIPRMSHLGIHVEPGISLTSEQDPRILYELMRFHGLVDAKSSVLVLLGEGGSGQADPLTGRFSVQCDGAYLVGPKGVKPHKRGILVGTAQSILPRIVAGIGETVSDLYSYCIKYGQAVPVGGTANTYVFVEGGSDVSFYNP